MLKYLLIFCLFSSNLGVFAQISSNNANKIADFIYIIEGGDKTKYPYGIISIDTGGDKEKARRICLNTINNNYKRWEKAGKPGEYIDFLADRYCPPSADKQGNINWKKNIKFYMRRDKIEIK